MGLPLWKNLSFLIFWSVSFYNLERRFLVLQYRKTLFPGKYCLKNGFDDILVGIFPKILFYGFGKKF